MGRSGQLRRLCSSTLHAGLILAATAATSWADTASKRYDVPSQPLGRALKEFARQANATVLFADEVVDAGLKSPPLHGAYDSERALQILLDRSGFGYQKLGDKNYVVRKQISSWAGSRRPEGEAAVAAPSFHGEGAPLGSATAGIEPLGNSGAEVQANDAELNEIIVTATKRALRLQDTPLAVSALGGERLERIGADGFAGFYRMVPGLVFNQADPNQGSFSIRGISTGVTTGNTQSTVALYIDELPTLETFGASSTPDLRLFDIERVEVLRGPQGTLFGSGSMGGAIRVITRKPELDDVAALTSLDINDTRHGEFSWAANAMANLPIVEDRLAVRAVGYYRDTGGWVDNLGRGVGDANSEEAYGGRLAVRLEPTEGLSLTGTITYQNSDPRDGSAFNRVADGTFARVTLLPEFVKDRLTIYNLVADYDLGWANLLSSTTYARHNVDSQADASFEIAPGVVGAAVPTPYVNDDNSKSFAQEIRLSSSGSDPLSWIIGAFYLDRKRSSHFVATVPGAGALYAPIGFPSDVIFDAEIETPGKEKALFGELGYEITDRLTATVGLRWFGNSSTYDEKTSGLANGGTTANRRHTDQERITPKFLLSYKPSDDALVYLLASQGYRVGQNNPVIPLDPTGNTSPDHYDADTLWNYEIGAKTSWFDDRLILNGAIYYIDWSDMQVDQERPDGFNFIANVGSAHSLGLELEGTAYPAKGLEISMALSLNEAELDEDNPQLDARKGDRTPGAPRLTIANGVQYGFALSETVEAFARLDHQYVGRSYSRFNRETALAMGDYHNVDLRVGMRAEHFGVTAYVRNLFDTDSIVTASGTRSDPINSYFRLRPRTIGVQVEARF